MVEGRPRRGGELRRAIREVRIAHSERNDVVVEFREAEIARLELLGEALEGVIADLPPDGDQFLVGILPGQPPRFWVDATSFVVMGRDKRQYLFQKDSRLGRTTLAEGANVETIADAVTRYVAERIVEREQAIEGDWVANAMRPQRRSSLAAAPRRASADRTSLIWVLCGFGLGVIAGMFLIIAVAWFMVD
jgi:hypothetical protein